MAPSQGAIMNEVWGIADRVSKRLRRFARRGWPFNLRKTCASQKRSPWLPKMAGHQGRGSWLVCLLITSLLCPRIPTVLGQVSPAISDPKPYRALLVVEHWNDPAGLLVDSRKDEFQPVAALLKAWLVPFDILRLDLQVLDGSHLFDRSGKPRYGIVIWLADLESYEGHNLQALGEAVQAGTGFLVAKSRFQHPVLEQLLGLKFKEAYTAVEPFRVARSHFITREL